MTFEQGSPPGEGSSKGAGTGLLAGACPLCFSGDSVLFHQDLRREYFQCLQCTLVFVDPEHHLNLSAEKAYYDLHQNYPLDSGYRTFLERLSIPLLKQLAANSQGLDFGSGPGPTLSRMLEEAGYSVALYDPFYAPDQTVFDRQYDFITSTEVVEHLKAPGIELNRLWTLLKPNGILAIMTKRVIDQTAFAGWHYKNDPTHISFFSEEAFNWLASIWQAKVVFYGADVVFLNKGS